MEDQIQPPEDQNEPDFPARYESLISTVDDLPTLPAMMFELKAALDNAQSDATEVAFVIEKDPSLAVNVLRCANSAFFGFADEIITLKDAVAKLGFNEIGKLGDRVFILDTFSNLGANTDPEDFWKHSFRVACLAQNLCEYNAEHCTVLGETAYIAGLLHDIGKLILDQYFEEDYGMVVAYREAEPCNDAVAERAVLGMDHGEVAGQLMEYWGFSDELVHGVQYHHAECADPDVDLELAEVVRVADVLSYAMEDGATETPAIDHPTLTLSQEQFEELFIRLKQEEALVTLLLSG